MLGFKPVLHDDIPQLVALADEIWHEYFPTVLSPEQTEYMINKFDKEEVLNERIQQRGRRYFFIVNGSTTMGYFAMSPRDDAQLVKMYLKKEFRGKGIGKKAMKRIYKICREEGYSKIYMAVEKKNTAAVAAFRTWGFEVAYSQTNDIGDYVMDIFVMVKPL